MDFEINSNGIGTPGGLFALAAFIVACIAAWFTHIFYSLMAAKYVLLIAGGLVPPVGVIHGVGIWFGAGW